MRRLLGLVVLLSVSCVREQPPGEEVIVNLCSPGLPSRASDPDELLITDYNLYIYNQFGFLEKRLYVPAREMGETTPSCTVRLLKDAPYIVLAAANMGYELWFDSMQQAFAYRYYMAYPDEFSRGMPMAACMTDAVAGDDLRIDVPLQRLMSRVDLSIDRRGLNQDVSIRINSVQVGNAASSAMLFSDSRVENWSQIFTEGYEKSGEQVYWLNHDLVSGVSGEVPFYLLENRPGSIAPSYIELKADYHSATFHTAPDKSLIYRFYITDDKDAKRNSRYPVVLRLKGSGLECEDGWSVSY